MKFHRFVILVVFLTSVACARAAEVDCINDNEVLLQQLDRAIERKAEYQHRRLHTIFYYYFSPYETAKVRTLFHTTK